MSSSQPTYSFSQKFKKAFGLNPGEPKKLPKTFSASTETPIEEQPAPAKPSGRYNPPTSMKSSLAAHTTSRSTPSSSSYTTTPSYINTSTIVGSTSGADSASCGHHGHSSGGHSGGGYSGSHSGGYSGGSDSGGGGGGGDSGGGGSC